LRDSPRGSVRDVVTDVHRQRQMGRHAPARRELEGAETGHGVGARVDPFM
jgi:hypothetical protein